MNTRRFWFADEASAWNWMLKMIRLGAKATDYGVCPDRLVDIYYIELAD